MDTVVPVGVTIFRTLALSCCDSASTMLVPTRPQNRVTIRLIVEGDDGEPTKQYERDDQRERALADGVV